MHATVLRQAPNVTGAISKLLPPKLPPSLSRPSDPTLFQLLTRTPRSPKGAIVHQQRWSQTGKVDWFWKITDAHFKCEGKHGKVWGIFYSGGRRVSEKPELIRHALKYSWAGGRSRPITTPKTTPVKQLKPNAKSKPVPN